MSRYTILVCGGRAYADKAKVSEALTKAFANRLEPVLLHGASTGADQLASEWAREAGIQEIPFPANWELWGRKAGPIRNNQMLLMRPDLVIAFPGGRGTADMVRRAKREGFKVVEITA